MYMRVIDSVQEGIELVQSFQGRPEDFQLLVPDSLLDPEVDPFV